MHDSYSNSVAMNGGRNGKSQYSESEAAAELGVSIDQLRSLIQRHIVEGEEPDTRTLPLASFQPSDLVLLRILAASEAQLNV